MNLVDALHSTSGTRMSALRGDLDRWTGLAAAGQPLEIHNSQVKRLDDAMTGLLSLLEAPADDELPAALQQAHGTQAVHLVWDFFRDQLDQRLDETLRPTLQLADDLAWACYRPAVAASSLPDDALREPPLVHFAARPSPFMWTRAQSFAITEHLSQRWRDLFVGVLHHLPIPVVGLPWGDARHLAGLVAVAHEVGHCVYEDLGLEDSLHDMAGGFAGSGAWVSWTSELFADLWGVLGCGSAYVAMMAVLLADTEAALKASPDLDEPGDYPPNGLRMQLLLHMAEQAGADVSSVQQAWQAICPADFGGHGLLDDGKTLTTGFLDEDLPGLGDQPAGGVLAPPGTGAARAFALNQVGQGGAFTDLHKDPRVVVAGLAQAWLDQPVAYAALESDDGAGRLALLERYATIRSAGVRSVTQSPPDADIRQGLDRAKAQALMARFLATPETP